MLVCLRPFFSYFDTGAGFTLSGAPVQKKCEGPSPRKKLATFFSHHWSRLTCQFSFSWKSGDLFSHYCRCSVGVALFRYFGHAKIRRSFCGAPYCRAPVRPNMLNMPKSAAVWHFYEFSKLVCVRSIVSVLSCMTAVRPIDCTTFTKTGAIVMD